MHPSVMAFASEALSRMRLYIDLAEASVLEVGSRDVNGSVRELFIGEVRDYLGVDLVPGQGVDMVLDAARLPFRDASFDIVIATEMLEHAKYWKACLRQMKRVLCVGGFLMLSTRSPGFPRHEEPDYWRFPRSLIERAMEDLDAVLVRDDPYPGHPGILGLWRKGEGKPLRPRRWHHLSALPLDSSPS